MRFAFSQLLCRIAFAIRCLWPHKKTQKTSHRSAWERQRSKSEKQSRKTKGVKTRNKKKHTHTQAPSVTNTTYVHLRAHQQAAMMCSGAKERNRQLFDNVLSLDTNVVVVVILQSTLYFSAALHYLSSIQASLHLFSLHFQEPIFAHSVDAFLFQNHLLLRSTRTQDSYDWESRVSLLLWLLLLSSRLVQKQKERHRERARKIEEKNIYVYSRVLTSPSVW